MVNIGQIIIIDAYYDSWYLGRRAEVKAVMPEGILVFASASEDGYGLYDLPCFLEHSDYRIDIALSEWSELF